MKKIKTDVCVIGAGSGGLSVASGAVQMGAKVVLIEAGEMGGDCLNYGCVPSKALLSAAKQAHVIREGGAGIAGVTPQVDYAAAMDHVQSAIATIAPHDSQERFEGLGCTVIRAHARFISPRTVQAGDTEITARRFVIATGSRAFIPPIDGLKNTPFLTNETLWAQRSAPKHLLILGGGPIGMEMAQAHRRLGSDVTVVDAGKALGRDDPEAAEVVKATLRNEGVSIIEDAPVIRVSGGAGDIQLHLKDGQTLSGTDLLVAVGRVANTDSLDAEKARIDLTSKGVKVDAALRSSNRRVYAIGDAAGGMQFTHVAGYHAGVLIRALLFGLPAKAASHHIPRATYTDPELAQIGMTESEAREAHGNALTVTRAEISGNDRAIATGRSAGGGFIKVMIVKKRPVGVTIVGPDAGELISFWALVAASGLKMGQIAGMVAPYPTLMEVNKRAAGAYFTPKLFESPRVKTVVKLVQRFLP
ncbi:pyruvate/2-oxoglutarate dehydrogenase complex dihydrolipoamide dehydrogenase (E3) component [Pacificibacter maritimus]|uniref:Pyruvate/2-oxoglutarate dehydrogenase complex dihydrolipoamide dehydrogenase (E3) component n=1 Tax=Pacificibacter maritimus TaxID=762213 RepID=A0A3N4U889_9RHOB|nr:FAD-dependent oxidoreductase [Pacificibacter maritimus]RPE63321.1 pyruvate/2-oxoglutarate dehydrogenase complex dihydrolipoamide dehydrogenase (E3) component [Pacificibacter maritimus]